MRFESKKYLYDIARASELAMQFIAGKSFADYGSSAMLRSAVERQLEIVGEALAQLARIDPATASRISEPRRIIAFRHLRELYARGFWNTIRRLLYTPRWRCMSSLLVISSAGKPV